MAALLVLTTMLLSCAAGVSAQAPGFHVVQPESVSGVVWGSVTLPCSFSYPERMEPASDFRVYWRIDKFHGDYIYRHSESFTRADFRGRISLVGDPEGQKTASIRLTDLRESDNNTYFCRVQVTGSDGETKVWQSVPGTELRVSAVAPSTTIQTTNYASSTTTQMLLSTSTLGLKPREDGGLPIPLIIGIVVGTLLLICTIGITCFFLKRSKGRRQAQKDSKELKETAQPEMYASIGREASLQPGNSAPESKEEVQPEDGLVYASLDHKISQTARKEGPSAPLPEEEMIYTAVRGGALS